jgi:quercetin dioxygenase-like cupin family protein
MKVEVFRIEDPPGNVVYGPHLQAGIVRGNAGSLVVIRLGPGELPEHQHEAEHVGVVLAGEFSFTAGDEEVRLRAGDLYRVPASQPHGVRCRSAAIIVQARA